MKAFISTADSNANPDKQQQSPLRESLIKARTNVLRKIVDCYLETNNLEYKKTIGKNQGINQAHNTSFAYANKKTFLIPTKNNATDPTLPPRTQKRQIRILSKIKI
jgi:hypothetical protein